MTIKTARNSDHAEQMLRDRVEFRTRVRLYDRYGNFGPFVSMSGTEPCGRAPRRTGGPGSVGWLAHMRRACHVASAKQGATAWMGETEGSIDTFCHSTGNLPHEYYESLATATYVVRSFDTPIAWHTDVAPTRLTRRALTKWLESDGMWVIPEVSYSPTTYQHQGSVDIALRGYWRHPEWKPLPAQYLTIPGALTKVPSGGR